MTLKLDSKESNMDTPVFMLKIKIGKYLCYRMELHRNRAFALPYVTDKDKIVFNDVMTFGLGDIKFKFLWENIESNLNFMPTEDYRLSIYYRYVALLKEVWVSLKEKTLINKIKRILS